ncbi:Ferric uptake regulation protein [Anaerohalosphaera lusitana]|uniref:Ferric uptake regulation protein n=1 Tax=Anaerohalosphaera lusitana TaxID=1936003 RepID=A0A1U9NHU9_9BACT|nr:Fur family transcriptional regulator [Anaerohalosphaera lusitana]AQT67385.1 Ferric uptake regulation protein [Anaerohalosphaera lusitana]
MGRLLEESKVRFDEYLRDKNLRRSARRDKVVDAFLRTERHLSIQELYDLVRKKDKDIGYATVARAVGLMTEAGLCREVDFGEGLTRYEHEYGHEHHDHLVCTGCGAFVEIYSPKLERLQAKLVEEHGYVEESHKLNIFGICPKCQKKQK